MLEILFINLGYRLENKWSLRLNSTLLS